jgi:curved DNA-binding protein CbpA
MQSEIDHYEVLQIGRNADAETIHRVYRIMAARFHPDNPRTGNTDTFLLLKRAYEVLVDPERRAKYDHQRQAEDEGPLPIFELQEFVHGLKGEMNRRLGVLALLYNRRRANEDSPGMSMLELEKRMAFPREHLNFALWYLRAKGFVTQQDNSDCGITAEGIDFIESKCSGDELIKRLLHAGPGVTFASEPGVGESPLSEREATGASLSARLALAN